MERTPDCLQLTRPQLLMGALSVTVFLFLSDVCNRVEAATKPVTSKDGVSFRVMGVEQLFEYDKKGRIKCSFPAGREFLDQVLQDPQKLKALYDKLVSKEDAALSSFQKWALKGVGNSEKGKKLFRDGMKDPKRRAKYVGYIKKCKGDGVIDNSEVQIRPMSLEEWKAQNHQ